MQLNKPLVIREGVEWVEADGEILLLDLWRGQLFGLNAIGSHIWKGLVEGLTLHEIIQALEEEFDKAEFDAAGAMLQSDAIDFVQALLEKELVLADSPSRPDLDL